MSETQPKYSNGVQKILNEIGTSRQGDPCSLLCRTSKVSGKPLTIRLPLTFTNIICSIKKDKERSVRIFVCSKSKVLDFCIK